MGEGKAVEITEEGERQRGQTKVLVEANLGTIVVIRSENEARHEYLCAAASSFVSEQL